MQSTPPMVTWTSSILPVSRNRPKIVMRVPPALGPLEGFTSSGIGSWWRGWRSEDTAWIHQTQYSSFPCAHTSSNPEANTRSHTQEQHTDIVLCHIHTHVSSNPPWSTPALLSETFSHTHTALIQAPHLPQFAEQTVRRSTPLWGSFSGARDMKSQLNSYAVAC